MENSYQASEILVPIGAFLMIASISIAAIFYSYRRKAVLVEKGYTADEIIKILGKKQSTPADYLKHGIVAIGVAVGLMSGGWLNDMTNQDFWFPACITLGTGVGLILAYKVKNRSENE